MSTAPDGAPPARRNAASTRDFHLRRILRGRASGYAVGLGLVGAFVLGAWSGSIVVMLGGPLLVGALVLAAAFWAAGGRAERDFFLSFSAARGLRYVGETGLPPLTPLLGAGERREFRHWMVGPLGERAPDEACGLGHYTWHERSNDIDESHEFTICVVDLEPGIAMFPGVFLTRRRGLAGVLGGGWLSTGTRRRVELESARLVERYELWVERNQDDLLLRELFSPSLVAWLAEHPLGPCFEYRAGTLVVYLERRLDDAARLGWLQDATGEIASRLAREVREAAA